MIRYLKDHIVSRLGQLPVVGEHVDPVAAFAELQLVREEDAGSVLQDGGAPLNLGRSKSPCQGARHFFFLLDIFF